MITKMNESQKVIKTIESTGLLKDKLIKEAGSTMGKLGPNAKGWTIEKTDPVRFPHFPFLAVNTNNRAQFKHCKTYQEALDYIAYMNP